MTITHIPIFAVLIILQKLASTSFRDFFSFFMTWSATQSKSTVSTMLRSYPIPELYTWGNQYDTTNRDVFHYFMDIAGSLHNEDALFYKSFKIVLQRNTGCFNQFNHAYESLELLANNNHNLSTITVKVLDIYYSPEKREKAIHDLAHMTTTPEKVKHIRHLIRLLKIIVRNYWPNELFTELFGPPICQQHNHAQPKYVPDGMLIQSSRISDYECQQCKVAIIVACFAGFSQSATM